MIIKGRGSKQNAVKVLECLLRLPLPAGQKALVERELRLVRAGEKGEKDSAYFIDFKYGASEYWAVIHDLRLEFDGKVAQIDHIIMNRWFDVYVLESKYYSAGIRITPEGEFYMLRKNGDEPIESPIEQNARHICLLEKATEHHKIMPTKVGIRIKPKFKNYVLVSPRSEVIRPSKRQFDTSHVIKSDLLVKQITKETDDIWMVPTLAKMCTSDTLMTVAARLAGLHRPASIDYKKKFGITECLTSDVGKADTGLRVRYVSHHQVPYYCFTCRKPLTNNVAHYCQQNWPVFGGKVYCFDCQKLVNGHSARPIVNAASLGRNKA